jgi:mRNA interferase RelE/StbE
MRRSSSWAKPLGPSGAKKLRGVPLYRIRLGAIRILYDINDAQRLVSITKIGYRRDVYRE